MMMLFSFAACGNNNNNNDNNDSSDDDGYVAPGKQMITADTVIADIVSEKLEEEALQSLIRSYLKNEISSDVFQQALLMLFAK